MSQQKTRSGDCYHFSNDVVIYCQICMDFFPCRICHDSFDRGVEHSGDPRIFSMVKCMICNNVQSGIENTCASCGTQFAKYFCRTCVCYANEGNYLHCEKCQVCRTERPGEYFHCDDCDNHVRTSDRKNHKCTAQSTTTETKSADPKALAKSGVQQLPEDAKCSVCNKFLREGYVHCVSFKCNHVVHKHCWRPSNPRCPICHPPSDGVQKPMFGEHGVYVDPEATEKTALLDKSGAGNPFTDEDSESPGCCARLMKWLIILIVLLAIVFVVIDVLGGGLSGGASASSGASSQHTSSGK